MTATTEVDRINDIVNGHMSNGESVVNPLIQFELKRSSGWYDAIDSPVDPLPGGLTWKRENEDDEWGENNPFYTIDVEAIQDLKSIQDESGCALSVSFAPGDYGLPTIEILDGVSNLEHERNMDRVV